MNKSYLAFSDARIHMITSNFKIGNGERKMKETRGPKSILKIKRLHANTCTVIYNEDCWSTSFFSYICLGCETTLSSVHQNDLASELAQSQGTPYYKLII